MNDGLMSAYCSDICSDYIDGRGSESKSQKSAYEKPSRFLAHGEQVSGWASSALLFFVYSHIMYIEEL